MIAAIDIETAGLNTHHYLIGCIITEVHKPQYFYSKKALWEHVLDLAKKEQRKKHVLNIYSHNASYDFYAYANLTDPHIKIFSQKPFIASYEVNGKTLIKFLDTLGLYRMSLEEVGKLLNNKKLDMPKRLEDENKHWTLEEIQELHPYVLQDTKLTLDSVHYLKNKLKEENIRLKRLYTINQIAINYLLTKIKRNKKHSSILFWNPIKNEIRRTFRAKEIHEAYRGGRVECFHNGYFENVTYIDCNSLYPYSATKIRFPLLSSERKHNNPLQHYTQEELLRTIGISRCIITNTKDNLGLLPIRTPNGNYFPKAGKTLIGTWTHEELLLATHHGYKIHYIEWSITYEQTENVLKETILDTYDRRKRSKDNFDNYFYKQMMNCAFGKFAQTKTYQEFVIDSVERAKEYLKHNHDIVAAHEYNYVYNKTTFDEQPKKPYYCPIIPTLINAYARCYMYKHLIKIPRDQILYTDTDSIIFTGDHLSKFVINNELGDFKIEHEKQPFTIYGNKTYIIGDDIKVSGVHKKDLTKEKFLSGKVHSKKMKTLATSNNLKEVGTFTLETRDLDQQRIDHMIINKQLADQRLYIDYNIEDISHLLEVLQGIPNL